MHIERQNSEKIGESGRKTSVRILHLEDNPQDAALIRATLEQGGIACETTAVDNRAAFISALERGGMDLVISDYALPAFDGLAALDIARAKSPQLPFILVSGTLGEELAIESLKRGATDYVLKDRLSRLVPAVRRALKDIDESAQRRRLEEQFIEAQKMEVVGQLAGGVAHDFNNIIAIILGYGDLITQKLGEGSVVAGELEAMRNAAERACGLTRQLLVFSRKQQIQLEVVDLCAVVASVEKMLRRLVDENMELTFIPGKETGRVRADHGQIGQVLMNLVVNARDAMPAGGRITIETGNVTLEGDHARELAGLAAGDYVILTVSDTGTGMTEEIKAHIFEAFFTTKPKGKGTGLGLATCQTIVHQFGGQMTVSSTVGKGTTFQIYFPRVDLPLAVAAPPPQGPPPRGTETVLVVEDEPAVRNLARGILESQGYEVLTAANGQDGLRTAREHKGPPIRLVITDVIMPQMGGKVMSEWLKATYPDLKILFTSGYADDAIAHHGVIEEEVAFLPKPYTPSSLTRKVREILDAD
jgi:two-component system cell cycle sensor histidine kinase/response regulator CckA